MLKKHYIIEKEPKLALYMNGDFPNTLNLFCMIKETSSEKIRIGLINIR